MAPTSRTPHTPVLLSQVLDALGPRGPRDGATYVDGTFGAGGYSTAILESADCRVFGIDRDPNVLKAAEHLMTRYPGRLRVLGGCYGDMVKLLADAGVEHVDGIALDLGVSSMQIDTAERGFSFRKDGPLDMRMGHAGSSSLTGGLSAADVINVYDEEQLADIIYTYGEERASRKIAAAIVMDRETQPFTRTEQLAGLLRRIVKKSKDGIDPATRTFQALRIYVNDELGELDRGLAAAERLLSPGGRLAVVSFHSLEDRKVKNFLQARSGHAPRASRHLPDASADAPAPTFELLKRGAIKPTAEETQSNPRARSARLRAAERNSSPPWPGEVGPGDNGLAA
ncbi:MAG: 16S rRNA (cytosine(1402)-N(4))-methyltransferase RsmH [Rhodospirillaceae bacterium]|jgi:16S rRNA (cytosine1402-N4)-methyltransferase|nr:16S rRNA (cytosine(1402)-N(4))-methyltransferase RsmH [Rhodospirillaceae bacterium]MBT4219691.1 16S rRNA (cytosine(1402)-N(4))-methyltransferase RsmH [Rhodospirillaceae bacterium]MBT5309336.1 16S rRNA (cytosine(1402)-N(4))-methyltransferase RsmH [Rhodospirillaceae bacterium]MBT7355889.1 16S rRNA (cytosine(1402)-N(4))-methyltransferase RsmH [Rhodospirillaceae bacterium]